MVASVVGPPLLAPIVGPSGADDAAAIAAAMASNVEASTSASSPPPWASAVLDAAAASLAAMSALDGRPRFFLTGGSPTGAGGIGFPAAAAAAAARAARSAFDGRPRFFGSCGAGDAAAADPLGWAAAADGFFGGRPRRFGVGGGSGAEGAGGAAGGSSTGTFRGLPRFLGGGGSTSSSSSCSSSSARFLFLPCFGSGCGAEVPSRFALLFASHCSLVTPAYFFSSALRSAEMSSPASAFLRSLCDSAEVTPRGYLRGLPVGPFFVAGTSSSSLTSAALPLLTLRLRLPLAPGRILTALASCWA